jgi:predicted acetyltransferase
MARGQGHRLERLPGTWITGCARSASLEQWTGVSEIEIVHPVPRDQVVDWTSAMMTTFLADPAESRVWAQWRSEHGWSPERSWGARDRGRWIATLRTLETTLTVPGGSLISADALTNVTVAATHRRRGLLRSLLASSLDAASDRGDAVSVLFAAEYPIYSRFGYAPSTLGAYYTVYPRRRDARLRMPVPSSVRQVDAGELRAIAPGVFDTARRLRAGNIDRAGQRWDVLLATNGFPEPLKPTPVLIVHDGPHGPDGFLSWVVQSDWEDDRSTGAEIKVTDLWAATDEAYAGLWQYLLSLDVVEKIHIRTRPVDEVLRWLLVDGRALELNYAGDHLWLRLIDVPAALSARTYASGDRLVLEVIDDDLGGYAAGTYVLDGGACARTTAPADLRVHQRALAATYLGGFSLTQQVAAGGVQELTPGALARADAMFATALAPWAGTDF